MTDIKPAEQAQMIMERIRPGKTVDCFAMWVCRGEGRGCPRNKFRNQKKDCQDCVLAHDENETLGDLLKRVKRGDG